jgi:hypothetical protein
MPDKSTESKPTEQSTQEEVARLRAQVKELQEELARREASAEPSGAPRETSEVLGDIPGRFTDEAGRMVRAFTLASLEPLRLAADIIDTFAEEVSPRKRPEERVSDRGRYGERRERRSRSEGGSSATGLLRDLYSGFVKAVDRSLDIPSEMVDRFHDTYRGAATTRTR